MNAEPLNAISQQSTTGNRIIVYKQEHARRMIKPSKQMLKLNGHLISVPRLVCNIPVQSLNRQIKDFQKPFLTNIRYSHHPTSRD